ncbi:hypothetical protein [Burkholderia cepacia]|nr:hypothetical protein [Burkholderia cepacia]
MNKKAATDKAWGFWPRLAVVMSWMVGVLLVCHWFVHALEPVQH